jgi:hypothetical protein
MSQYLAALKLDNIATDDQTLVIDTVAPSFTTQANMELNNKSDLIINFNENIKTQGGSVEIWNASGNVETVVISNSDINNNTLTINPTNDLSEGSFYLKMASGVITDMAGNDAAAITKDSNQWAFEIKALSTSISLAGTNNTDDAYINAGITVLVDFSATTFKVNFGFISCAIYKCYIT